VLALSGLVMYGFTHPSLIYLLEQLPGAHRCHLYEFKYHREPAVSALDDDDDVSLPVCAACSLTFFLASLFNSSVDNISLVFMLYCISYFAILVCLVHVY